MKENEKTFRDELQSLINRYSMENGSNTPDFILADYLTACLEVWDRSIGKREVWHGRTVGEPRTIKKELTKCR